MTGPSAASKKPQAEMHHFTAEVDKILHLMIHSLYAHKDIFLRELISNASDACDKLRYQALSNDTLLKNQPLGIRVITDEKKKILTITDNGIGMNKDELASNLGTIARSGTQSFLTSLTGNDKKDIQLIGQFGVGFYSAFMVADEVTAISRKAGEDDVWQWHSKGDGAFTITRMEDGSHPHGTSVILHMKEDCGQYLDKHRIHHIVRTYSDHIAFPVTFVDTEGKEEVINEGSALWARPKSDISEEQYNAFYKHVAHAADAPWMVMHNKNEGVISFTNLLFIPSVKPFDLFHPDRTCRVKLYVKRVFITDEHIDLVPRYMRFLQGVVDSEDLPLNISRETLQHNALVSKIRSAIVKRALAELKKKAEEAPDTYKNFWDNFGAVLKEGLCEGIDTHREAILEICQFHSTYSDSEFTTLDAYIKRMSEGQKDIYYLTGENLEALRHSPQLEGFKAKGIEVLLLSDHVDGFWVNVVHIYKNTPLVSVTREGINFDAITTPDSKDGSDKKDKKTSRTKSSAGHTLGDKETEHLITLFKDTLGKRIKDVKLSKKLTDSPVCLVTPEGGMDSRLERFLVDQSQLAGISPKILEINPSHPIIHYLHRERKHPLAKEWVELLFDQACIIEGEAVQDASAFSRRMNTLLEQLADAGKKSQKEEG